MLSPFIRACKTFLFIVLGFLNHVGFSQSNSIPAQIEPPSVIAPSPEASAFAKYGNIPVSNYTGVVNIDVPLYTISIRDIQIPISLSYHASGIKVQEEASRVGLGWVFNCGGVITRNIVGRDDLHQSPFSYLSQYNNSPELPLGPEYAVSLEPVYDNTVKVFNRSGDPQAPTVQHIDLQNYYKEFDYQPDEFTYNFMGRSGRFVMTRDGRAVVAKDEKIRIRLLNADGSGWEITTSDGFRYYFELYEVTLDNEQGQGPLKTAWYLTKVISPQNESVTFSYVVDPVRRVETVPTYYESEAPVTLSCPGWSCSAPQQRSSKRTLPNRHYSLVFLDHVDWKNGTIKVNYGDRADLTGDKRITKLELYDKSASQLRTEIDFVQDYFVSQQQDNGYPVTLFDVGVLTKRLKLIEVVKRPVPDLRSQREVYSFAYYDQGQSLPPKNSFATDHWGYYNGRNSNTSFIPEYYYTGQHRTYQDLLGIMGPQREPNADYAGRWMLKEITYPTKGKSIFYFEGNTVDLPASEPGNARPCLKQVTLQYPASAKGSIKTDTLDLRDMYVQGGGAIPVRVRAAFRASKACKDVVVLPQMYFELSNGSRVDISLPPCDGPQEEMCIYCEGKDQTTSNSPVFEYTNTYNLSPGIYIWKAYMSATATDFQDISVTYEYWAEPGACVAPAVKHLPGGGARISRIEDFSPEQNQTVNVRRFSYHYTRVNGSVSEIRSHGRHMIQPSYAYIDLTQEKLETLVNTLVCLECVHLVRTSTSNLPPTNLQGYHVGYSKVVEYLGPEAKFGRIEYEYENRPDLVLSFHLPNGAPMKPGLGASRPNALNGSLMRQTIFNAQGDTIKTIENSYESIERIKVYGIEYRDILSMTSQSSSMGTQTSQDPSGRVILRAYPAIEGYFNFIRRSIETHYKGNQARLADTSYFEFNNPKHLQLTRKSTTKSNGHKEAVDFKYAADYTEEQASPAVVAMKGEKFMHSIPLEVTTIDIAGDNTEKVISRDITVYDIYGPLVLPKEAAKMALKFPVASNAIQPYVPRTGYDPQLFKRVYTLKYDDAGTLRKMQKEQDYEVNYLWCHQGAYPVAQIVNGNETDCFSTSFEEDGELFVDSQGANLARTGRKVKNTSSYSFPHSFMPTMSNTMMSFWYWQNDTWKFSGVVPFQRTISTAGSRLDEIRAFPLNAMMTTYTYDLLYGLTSVSDQNNQTTYYEYDQMGRLKLIRDSNQKIVQTFLYHYRK